MFGGDQMSYIPLNQIIDALAELDCEQKQLLESSTGIRNASGAKKFNQIE